jgi:hypothetical protein
MELIDRYLNAVRFWLPRAQEDDIIAELGEDLHSQIEERETALGRALNEDELAEILKQRGHPMSVAGRYLPQRYLIGPALYPAYMVVLRLVILWILLPILILIAAPIAIATAADPTLASIKALWDTAMGCVFALGVITLVFAIIERHPIRELENWDPRKLPKIPARPLKSLSDPKPVERAQAIVEMACSVVFAAFFLHFIWFRNSFELGDAHIVLAPIWRTVLWPMLLIGLSGLPVGWISLAFRANTRLRSGMRIAVDVVTLGVVGVLGTAGTLITFTVRHLPADQMAEATKWTDVGVRIAVAAIALGVLVDLVQEGVRYVRARRSA